MKNIIVYFCLLLSIPFSLFSQSGVTINVKVFLSGCYTSNEMRADLLNKELLPLSQPFNIAPWNYYVDESVSDIPDNIVDWILIELRSDLYTKVSQKAGFLRKDGQIVSLDGSTNPSLNSIQSGEYFIIIYHRNHLAIMSSSKTLLNDNSSLYDFTDAQLKAYGINSLKDLGDGKFGLVAGDADQNGIINNLDYGPVANNIFQSSYIPADLDMSGFTNVLDYSQVYSNIFKNSFVPNEIEHNNEDSIIYVTTLAELQDAVTNSKDGDIIQIENDIEFTSALATDELGILFKSTERVLIEKDITIQGKSYVQRPRLYLNKDEDDYFSFLMFEVKNANVTFKKLKLDGSLWRSDFNGGSNQTLDPTEVIGISIGGTSQGQRFWENSSAIIDSCEIMGWSNFGVQNNTTAVVKNSYIHHNLKGGSGYGISNHRNGNLTVFNCVFDSNRHNIEHHGANGMITEIYNNIFYEPGFQFLPQIDHHPNTSGEPYAGGLTKIHHNTFYDGETRITYAGGIPYRGIYIYENKFLGAEWAWGSAGLSTTLKDSTDYKPSVTNNAFPNGYTAVSKKQYQPLGMFGVGSVGYVSGGDPYDEVKEIWQGQKNWFVSNNYYRNATWTYDWCTFQVQYEDSSGTPNWNRLAGFGYISSYPSSTYPLDSLGFGDFNGDGVTDIVSHYFASEVKKNYGRWVFNAINFPTPDSTHLMVSFGGIGEWVQLRDHNYLISDMIFADVNGDGETDIIVNDGGWKYAASGVKDWIILPNDISTYSIYNMRDFDGDGVDDPYRISSE